MLLELIKVYYEQQWKSEIDGIIGEVERILRRDLNMCLRFQKRFVFPNICVCPENDAEGYMKLKALEVTSQDPQLDFGTSIILINEFGHINHGIATENNWGTGYAFAVVQWCGEDLARHYRRSSRHMAIHGILHEIGHNLGMTHASRGIMTSDYDAVKANEVMRYDEANIEMFRRE